MKRVTAHDSAESSEKKNIILLKSQTVYTFNDFTAIHIPTEGESRRAMAHVGLKNEAWCPVVLFLDKLVADKNWF